ncbi:hypothetical protein C2I36_14890 [Rhodobacteraceae bacterium WD3A24]|nr:hypothetical protein C2I36_14890 [Rhodobacteraceae bacterium WD3A24]
MSFTADWLALREPADAAARDGDLLARAARLCAGEAAPVIVDLGCGTGATVRALGPLVPQDACWRLVDNDNRLLVAACAAAGERAEPYCRDLADIEALPLAGAHLVTASALLDLVSGGWLARLVGRLARAGTGFYAALSYDGLMEWMPPDPEDGEVIAAFNAHQATDKGLGPALGPAAGGAAAESFAAAGYTVETRRSPWRLEDGAGALRAELAAGVGRAAGEMGHAGAGDWVRRRRAGDAATRCIVGHLDMLATMPALHREAA